MTFKSYPQQSRIDWGREMADSEKSERSDLQFGAMLRIADACELMAKDRQRMEHEIQELRANRDYWHKEAERLLLQRSALRGVVTRLKRKNTTTAVLSALKEQAK